MGECVAEGEWLLARRYRGSGRGVQIRRSDQVWNVDADHDDKHDGQEDKI